MRALTTMATRRRSKHFSLATLGLLYNWRKALSERQRELRGQLREVLREVSQACDDCDFADRRESASVRLNPHPSGSTRPATLPHPHCRLLASEAAKSSSPLASSDQRSACVHSTPRRTRVGYRCLPARKAL